VPRVGVAYRAKDEAGNATGGSGVEVRIWDDFNATVAATVTDDTAGGTTITQPITPNSGAQTTLAVTTATGDTTLTVASTTGFAVGQFIPIYDGTNTRYRFIRSILAGPPRLGLEQTIGVVFSNTNTQVGNLDMVGVVAGYVSDTSYHYAQVKDISSSRLLPATHIPTAIGTANVGVLEEGAGGGTRPTVNFIGSSVTAVDNPGATRVDVTITGLQANGTLAAPSIGFVARPGDGLYSAASGDMFAVTNGHAVVEFLDQTSAVNYFRMVAGPTATRVFLDAQGSDTDVSMDVRPKGAGTFRYNNSEIATRAYADGLSGLFAFHGNGVVPTVSATRYWFGGSTVWTAEGDAQMAVPRAGTLKNLYIRTTVGPQGNGTITFTLRKNGVDTALVLSWANGTAASLKSDTSNTVAVVAGDLLSIKCVQGASDSGVGIGGVTLQFSG